MSHMSNQFTMYLLKYIYITTFKIYIEYTYVCISYFFQKRKCSNHYLKDEEVDVDAAGEDEEDGEEGEGHDDLLENLTCSRPTPSRQIFFIHKRKILREKVRKHAFYEE